MEYDAKQDIDYHLCIYIKAKINSDYIHDCHIYLSKK